ncbi:DoxX family protein [Haliangium sp.]|uniref:DoxX family protein n=1 Tax=Haliangium sp. TaxID=2663208 RepID=UPI003D1513B3
MQTFLRHLPTAARYLLGLIFVVFGLNGFLGFLPQPPVDGPAGAFLGALAATGYVFPVIKSIEILAGLMLLGGRLVPLALTLLAPIVVNIVLFHLVLAPANLALVGFILAAELYLAWSYRDRFRGLLTVAAKPRVAAAAPRAVPAPARTAA